MSAPPEQLSLLWNNQLGAGQLLWNLLLHQLKQKTKFAQVTNKS